MNFNFLKSNVLKNATTTVTPASVFPIDAGCLSGGDRAAKWLSANSAYVFSFEYKRDVASVADTLIILGAKQLPYSFFVQLDCGDGSYTNIFSGTQTPTGFGNSDFIKTFEKQTKKDFKITIAYTSDGSPVLTGASIDKIILGERFDLGQEPSHYSIDIQNSKSNSFLSSEGLASVNFIYPKYKLKFEYRNISDVNLHKFLNSISATNPYLTLFALSNDKLLNEKNLIYGKVSEINFNKSYHDLNNLSFEIEEK